MNMKKIFYTLALSGLVCCPQTMAQDGYDFTQDEPTGYDFTDEEAEADRKAEQQQKATQQLIYNGAQYVATCRKAYQEDIVWVISACCDGIIGSEDFVDCIYDPVPADLHRSAVSKIMGKHPFAADSGQFLQGPLSRSTLAQAKPNITAAQYAEIEHMITRSELLMKWFMGHFAKACALHTYDFLKEVQRVARFKEYLKTETVNELDESYLAMIDAFSHNYVLERINRSFSTMNANRKYWSKAFFDYFHNKVSANERDAWLCYVLLGGSSRFSPYSGPQFGVDRTFVHRGFYTPYDYIDIRSGKAVWASTPIAAELASYMRYFEFWSGNRIFESEGMGADGRLAVTQAFNQYEKMLSPVAAEIVVKEDADFRQTVNNRILYAMNKLVSLDDELMGFDEYLRKNSKFIKNRERTKQYGPLLQLVQQRIDEATRALSTIQKLAEQEVPATAASRQSD